MDDMAPLPKAVRLRVPPAPQVFVRTFADAIGVAQYERDKHQEHTPEYDRWHAVQLALHAAVENSSEHEIKKAVEQFLEACRASGWIGREATNG